MARSVSSLARSAAAIGAGVLTLCLAATSAPAAHGVPGGAGSAPLPTKPLRIITYNTEAHLDPPTAMEDLAVLMRRHPDIVSLQEMASPEKRRMIRETYVDCEGCVWGTNMPGPPVPGETPILYRADRFELKDSGSVQVTEPTYVGPAGAGPSTINAKFVNWVRLTDLETGRPVYVLNNHAVPSVQSKTGGPNRRSPARLKIYRQHMDGLQSLLRDITEHHWGLVFVTGDLNVNFRRDRVLEPKIFPYRKLGEVGLEASYQALSEPSIGTHTLRSGNDTRLIDYVYFLPRKPLQPAGQHIVRGLASDHRPLVVDFDVKVSRQVDTTSP
ncbi:MAG: hypothetical protein KDB43_16305 [Nocardioidaceae bacterium]|nr:hypothetical protein [Nocardioidaceae bacterium]